MRIPTLKGLHRPDPIRRLLWNPFRGRCVLGPITQGGAALTLGCWVQPLQGCKRLVFNELCNFRKVQLVVRLVRELAFDVGGSRYFRNGPLKPDFDVGGESSYIRRAVQTGR